MRLIRPLLPLLVVLSTSAWAAPTQAELPVSWTGAALSAPPSASERQGRCAPPQARMAADCGPVGAATGGGCLPIQHCQRVVTGDAGPGRREQRDRAITIAPAGHRAIPARDRALGAATAGARLAAGARQRLRAGV